MKRHPSTHQTNVSAFIGEPKIRKVKGATKETHTLRSKGLFFRDLKMQGITSSNAASNEHRKGSSAMRNQHEAARSKNQIGSTKPKEAKRE